MANETNASGLTAAQQAAAERILNEKREKRNRRRKKQRLILWILIPVLVLSVAGVILYQTVLADWFAYRHAAELLSQGSCQEAADAFDALGSYRDSYDQKRAALFALGLQQYEAGDTVTARRTFSGLLSYGESKRWVNRIDYESAEAAAADGEWISAIHLFDRAGTYEDAADKAADVRQTAYEQALALADQGDTYGAACLLSAIPEIEDSQEQLRKLAPGVSNLLAAGHNTLFAVSSDGKVRATGNNTYHQLDVDGWEHIIAIAAGDRHVVGLCADGTVEAAGDSLYGQCDVGDWQDMVAVAAGYMHTVGLRADGTVVAVGDNLYGQCDVGDWQNVVAIAAGQMHTVGLLADGTVVAAGSGDDGQCDVGDWSDIVMLAAGPYHTIGVRADGTVVTCGDNTYDQCSLSEETDVAAVSTTAKNTLLLKSDGTVYSFGSVENNQQVLESYEGVIAVAASDTECSVLLMNDGTVSVIGDIDAFSAARNWTELGRGDFPES